MTNLSLPKRSRGFSVVPFFGDLLVLTRLLRDGAAGWGTKLLAVFTILYVVSPVDLFPEALLPFIAWIDDVGLVLTLRLAMESTFAKYRYPLFGKPEDAMANAPVVGAPVVGAPAQAQFVPQVDPQVAFEMNRSSGPLAARVLGDNR